jgi:trk system potassium uptake protein
VTIKGLGFDEDVLEEAGIRAAHAFAAVTNLDNTNLMAAEVARKLFDVPHVVARLYNPSARAYIPAARSRLRVWDHARRRDAAREDPSGHGHHVSAIRRRRDRAVQGEPTPLRASALPEVEIARQVPHRGRLAARRCSCPSPTRYCTRVTSSMASVKEEAYAKIDRYMEE